MKTLTQTLRVALLSGLSLFTTSLYAQTATQVWEKRYTGPGSGNDRASSVAVDGAGNVVVAGTSLNASGNIDYYTAKYAETDGALLWEKRYNGPGNSSDDATSVAVDGAGNVVVTGQSVSANSGFDYYTAKYAATDGALLWENRYNGPGNSSDRADSVVVDGAGNVVVTGVSFGATGGNDYYTAKYAAADGALIWGKRYNGPANGEDYARSVAVDGAGNVVVTGASSIAGGTTDYYTAKYAADDGALLWEKRYNGPANFSDEAKSVALDGAGNVVVTGYSRNANLAEDYYTAKYAAADGSLFWEKRYNSPSNSFDSANSVVVDGAGNVVVTGYSFSSSANDYYTAKYAAVDGSLLWEKRYNGLGNGTDEATSLVLDGAGNVVVTGYSANASGDFDYYTAKYATADGALLWERRYNGVGNNNDVADSLAVDGTGNVVVTGYSYGGTSRDDYYTAKYASPQPPVLSQPTAGQTFGTTVELDFTIPVVPKPGTIQATFDDGTTERVLTFTNYGASIYDVFFNPANPTATPSIQAGSPIPDGLYTVRVSYEDLAGNVATTSVAGVRIDTVTLPPVLNSPLTGWHKSPTSLAYTLPEAALPGTLKAIFTSAMATRVLTLSAGECTAGAHGIAIDPRNLAASAGVLTCDFPTIPDGTYAVTLRYQDTVGNTAAVVGPFAGVKLDTVAPVGNPVVGLSPVIVGTPLPDYTPLGGGFDANGIASFTQFPAPGSTPPVGPLALTFTLMDPAGNTTIVNSSVTIRPVPVDPEHTALAAKGGAVPGAGSDVRIQAGAVWTGFGVPAVNRDGQVAFLGKWSAPKTTTLPAQLGVGIFLDGVLLVKAGDVLPGTGGAILKSFKNPVLAGNADVAVLVTLGGSGVTALNDAALVKLSGGVASLELREGAELPATGGLTWKTFTTVAIASESDSLVTPSRIGVVGKLLQGVGGVTVNNDGIGLLTETGGALVPVVREGDAFFGHTVKRFVWLDSLAGSPGHGRGLANNGGIIATTMLLTLDNGLLTFADLSLATNGSYEIAHAGGLFSEAVFTKLGVPCFAPNSDTGYESLSFLGSLKGGIGGVPATGASGIFRTADGDLGRETRLLIQSGKPVSASAGLLWKALKDPVSSHLDTVGDRVATIASISGTGVSAANDQVIAHSGDTLGSDQIIAREGSQPPDAPAGAQWSAFTSLAYPANAGGPIFTATLVNKTANPGGPALPGPGGITSVNDTGCWAVDSTGALRGLFREGDTIGGKTLKLFNVLKATVGSVGSTRAFNSAGEVVWQATFTDGTTAIVRTQVP